MRNALGYRSDRELLDDEMMAMLSDLELAEVGLMDVENHEPDTAGDLLVEILIEHEMERIYPEASKRQPEQLGEMTSIQGLFNNIHQLSRQVFMALSRPFGAAKSKEVNTYQSFLTESFQRGYVPSISELLDRFTVEAGSEKARLIHQMVMDKLMTAMMLNQHLDEFTEVMSHRLRQFELGVEILKMEKIYHELLLDLMPMTMERYGEPENLSRVEHGIREEYVALNGFFLEALTEDPSTGNFIWLPEMESRAMVEDVLPDIHLPQALSYLESPIGIAPMPNCH